MLTIIIEQDFTASWSIYGKTNHLKNCIFRENAPNFISYEPK